MSLTDPTESADSFDPGHWDDPVPAAPTLAARRPGHAAMTHLLDLLGSHGAEPAPAVPPTLRSWHVGVVGEQVVGQELALLPAGWRVLHALPAGSPGADIDHLVIGPGGVFVLNTKHHARKTIRMGTHVVWIDGFQQAGYQRELLRRSLQVREVLRDLLPAGVSPRPLLVFVKAKRVAFSGDQTVEAVPSSELVDHLLSLDPVLDADVVDAMGRRAAQPAAWGAPESVLEEPDPTMRFLSLQVSQAPAVAIRAQPRTAPAPTHRRRRRTAAALPRGVVRLLALGAALVGTLLVLSAAVAVIVTVLEPCLRLLTGP